MSNTTQKMEPSPPPIPEPTTDMQFNDTVIRSSIPVVLLVWAPHATHSEAMTQELQHIAPNFEGKVRFVSINADKNPETFGRYDIRTVPTLLFFHNKKIVDRIVGLMAGIPLISRIVRMLEATGEARRIQIQPHPGQRGITSSDQRQQAFLR